MVSANVYQIPMTKEQLDKFLDGDAYVALAKEYVYNNAEEVEEEEEVDVNDCELEELVCDYELVNSPILTAYGINWDYTTYLLGKNKLLVILLIEWE